MIGLLTQIMWYHNIKQLYFKKIYKKLAKLFYENKINEDVLFITTKLLQ